MLVDKMSGMDVGLRPSMPYFKSTGNDRPPEITYMRIHECDKFSVCIHIELFIKRSSSTLISLAQVLIKKLYCCSYDICR